MFNLSYATVFPENRGDIKIEMMTTMMGFLDQPFLLDLRSRMTLLQGDNV